MSKTGKPAAFILKSKKEPLCVRIIKYLMLALFAYGVIFWGSVTVASTVSPMTAMTSASQKSSSKLWV